MYRNFPNLLEAKLLVQKQAHRTRKQNCLDAVAPCPSDPPAGKRLASATPLVFRVAEEDLEKHVSVLIDGAEELLLGSAYAGMFDLFIVAAELFDYTWEYKGCLNAILFQILQQLLSH